ncbi:MAG TPA: hypothetical protein VFO05_17005 [Candidatus Limnocylindrales bacterium]|nr:hypothetical protein [Candidatus Limnocylindrales bacterium]
MASGAASADGTGAPTEQPSLSSSALQAGTVVRAERAIELTSDWTIEPGQLAYVVEGPVDGPDGPSYQIQTWGDLVTGLQPDTVFGVVGLVEAEASLVESPPRCPTGELTLAAIASLQPFERLVCFGSRELTFGPVTASDYRVGVKTSPRWLLSEGRWPDFFTGLPYYASGPGLSIADGEWVIVTGHFDAPSSVECGSAAEVTWCRERFFLTAKEPADPPDFVLRGEWRSLAPAPISGRTDHRLAWTGREMIVWGGSASDQDQTVFDGSLPSGGAAYDPAADAWRLIPDAPVAGRLAPVVAWTGSEMLVFGGFALDATGSAAVLDGAAYDPSADRWRPIAPAPLTGNDTVGGWVGDRFVIATNDATAAYDPATDSWTTLPRAPIRPGWRTGLVSEDRLVVIAYGDGASAPVEQAILDPATETWRTGTVPLDPLSAGSDFIGIGDGVAAVTLGQSLDPVTGEWSDFPPCKLSGGVWTGSIVVSDSAAWDPATNSCRQLPPSPPRGEPFDDGNGREFAVAIWTGEEYITWSGGTGGDIMWVPNDGAAFRPD